MGNVIDLKEHTLHRSIDEDCRAKINGVWWYKFGAEYEIEGQRYSISFYALDFEDAEKRVEAMKNSLSVYGQIGAIIPA